MRAMRVLLAALPACVVAALALHAAGAQAGSPQNRFSLNSSAISGSCSHQTAVKLAVKYAYGEPIGHPLLGFICGQFTGAGSTAMAAVYHSGTCLPFQGFAVFRRVAGVWNRVLPLTDFGVLSIKPVGSDIKETAPVYNPGDPRCNPSGGTRSRIWHWNGQRLVAGAWSRFNYASFLSPDKKIWCLFNSDGAFCSTPAPGNTIPANYSARMSTSGQVQICSWAPGQDLRTVCQAQQWDYHAPVLKPGYVNLVYRYRCTSTATSVTCTVNSGAGKGNGFRITPSSVTKLGP